MKKVLMFFIAVIIAINCFSQSLPSYLPSSGLVAWYPFNGNANDESGNGNNGTVYGGVSLTSDKDGFDNKAYDWPTSGASSNYIDIPDITHFFTNSFTLTAWIYMDGGSMDPRVISKGEMGVIANGTSNTSRTLRCYWDPGGLGFSPTNPVPAKQWVHIAFTADGNGGYARFYINGEILNEGCCGQTTGSWPSGLWNIGRKSIGAYDSWGGKLDDIAIYNRALSQQEITQIYITNTPSNCVANILNNDTTICSGSTINLTVNGSSSTGTNSSCFSPKVIGLSNTNFGLNAACKDNNDNIFVAGAYTGNTNFGNVTLAGIGGRDVFLVKYNSCGVQQWALRGGSTGNEDYAGVGSKSIATDSLGNVFIVGRYNQAFTFYGNNSTSFVAPYTATSNGNHQDGYLIKINSNGEVLWGATLRGGSNDGFNGVAVDNAGNPIVTGGFNGCCPSTFAVTIYGPNGSLGVSSFGSNYGSGLVVKFDANGNIIWKAAVYNRDTDLDKLAIDGANNIYLASEFRSWSSGTSGQFIDANGTNNSLYNPGIGLGFLVKLNSSGIWQWGVTYGNVGDGVSSLTSGTDVTIDNNGNPWISGFYRGALATFYTTSGSTLSLPASTNDIGFIAKYSAAGVPQLVNSLQQSTGATYFNSIAIANDTIAIAGFFTGNNFGSNDVLLAKYNTSAVLQSIKTGGGTGDDQANSVVANGASFIVSGTIGGASTIDDVTLNSAGTFLWNNNTNGVNSSTYLWSTGATTPSISVSPSVTTNYFCTVSNGDISCTDSVKITVSNLNSSLFSQDTIRSCGTPYSLDAGSGYSSYSWSNGATSQSINVTSTGWYKCTVSYGTCNAVDSIFLSIVQADILNVDTSICLGSSVTLNALSTCNGIQTQDLNWELLIPANSYVGGETNFDQAGFDQSNQILYSVLKNGSANRVYAFNLIDKTVSSLTSNNAPSELYEYAFDKTNNRIVSSRVGRDVVYALPLNGGTWQQIGSGSFDAESYGCSSFWNPISSRFGYFGGYGYYSTKNWIWENNGSGWLNTYANNNDCNLARRVGNQLARNNNGSKYYVFSGQGSCDGNQFASSCSLGSPWPSDVGVYCWLRDLWELDLSTYQFTNILPANNQSILREGSFSYDYTKNTFYIIGGNAPTAAYGVYTPYSMDVLKYDRNVNSGFSAVTTNGTPPSATSTGVSIYDSIGNRIIYARADGIWALNLGSTCSNTYLWSNNEATTSTTVSPIETTKYYVSVSNGISSCTDSVTVQVNQPTSSSITVSSCDSYLWKNQTYTQSGVYTWTGSNAAGCDSVVTLNLTITPSTFNTTSITSCDSYFWPVNATAYTSSGTYSLVKGCNTEILNLTITASTSNTTTASACDIYTWSVNGQVYTQSGSYSSVNGCHTEILNLTVTASSSNITTTSACDTYTWSVNSQVYTQSGSYTSVAGCQTEILNLTITPSSSNTTIASACNSYTWSINSQVYTQSGSYTSVSNCNTEILNLTITASTSNTTTTSACDSYTWSVNSQVYTQSGSYTSVTRCHTEILNLTITLSTSNTTTASACGSYTWSVNSQVYTQSGSYTSVNGCRTEILNLTITPKVIKTTALTVCGSYLWATSGQTYNISGSYTFVSGCNSYVLNLTINANSVAPTAASASSTTVTSGTSVTLSVTSGALGTGASWKWYSGSCGGTLLGTGASISVAPTATTTYFVRAEGACNTTSCASVKVTVQAACGPTVVTSNATGNAVCSGRSVTLTVQGTLATGASWKWYKNGCGTGSSIGSGASLTVTPTANTTYYVRSEGGTCGTSTCKSIAVTVSPLPSTPGTVTGNTTGVCNTAGIGYSIAAVSGATSYAWKVPTGATIISGQGTTAIVVNYGSSIGNNSSCGSTSVCVKAVNACGSSANKCLLISTTPPTASCRAIVGPSTACTNINATYSCSAVAGANTYTWVVPTGWTIISGQGTISLVVKPSTSQGTVKVTPSNSCGSGSSSSKSVKASSCTTPVYTKGAFEIPVETIKDISIWPNPANSYFNLNYVGDKPNKIEFFDATGKLIISSGWKSVIDVNRFNSGIYYLRIHRGNLVETKKIEIIK